MGITYFVIAISACIIGALTGMGGGVFMKPILDMLGRFDVSSINMVSSITVFSMSIVSVFRQRKNPERPATKVAISLAVGAVAGGSLGSNLFQRIASNFEGSRVTLVQNLILAVIVICIFCYMRVKGRVRSPKWGSVAAGTVIGLVLGVISSFLGIGGGPLNVSLIIFCFGYSTKQAALCSLITILFSQAAKIVPALISGQIWTHDLVALPWMVVGAVAGGLLGSSVSKKISEKSADKLFNLAQVMVFVICMVNAMRSMGS